MHSICRRVSVLALALMLTTGCASSQKSKPKSATTTPAAAGGQVEVEELEVGEGPTPKKGQQVILHVVGKLENGREFENTRKAGKPLEITLGEDGVLPAFEDAVPSMQVGGRYRLKVPPDRGYGDKEHGKVPANSKLIYEVELVGIKQGDDHAKKGGGGRHGGGRGGGMGGMGGGRRGGGGGGGGGMGGMGGMGGY